MNKPFGPFRLTGGTHSEDYPLDPPIKLVVEAIEPGLIVTKAGTRIKVSRNTYLLHEGKEHVVYVGDRKVTPGELSVGDEAELALQREFDRASEPFMSGAELDVLFNSRDSVKFVKVGGQASGKDRDELASLRKEVAELRERQRQADLKNQQGKGQPQGKGSEKQLVNA